MNKQQRINNLMPNGTPRYIRVYDFGDNENASDRYTVVFTGNYTHKTARWHWYMGLWDGGSWSHGEHEKQIDTDKWGFPPKIGGKNHLGRRIEFKDLPQACQETVLEQYKYLWDIETKKKKELI